jgi:tungstate transport system substrate-binding protein
MKKLVKILAMSAVLATASLSANSLMMATTTSTDNTGLLDYLAPKFKQESNITLKWVATGTGKALKMGENCDVDILLVHAPAAEKKFVQKGFGKNRQEVMYNDFVFIGSKQDPALVKGKSSKEALQIIQASKSNFFSRGDNSGTNKKELSLWKEALNLTPEKESWYIQTGQGMLRTINMASEKNGYTLTDRGTWIKYMSQKKQDNPMQIVVENEANLFNQYSVITINKEKCSNVKTDLAQTFTTWITSPSTQKLIADFRLLEQALFVPNAKQ